MVSNMIMRGTTPYHSFILPIKAEEIDKIYLTYLQNDKVILDKTNEDVTITDSSTNKNDKYNTCSFVSFIIKRFLQSMPRIYASKRHDKIC